jgi:hypothetical protein
MRLKLEPGRLTTPTPLPPPPPAAPTHFRSWSAGDRCGSGGAPPPHEPSTQPNRREYNFPLVRARPPAEGTLLRTDRHSARGGRCTPGRIRHPHAEPALLPMTPRHVRPDSHARHRKPQHARAAPSGTQSIRNGQGVGVNDALRTPRSRDARASPGRAYVPSLCSAR